MNKMKITLKRLYGNEEGATSILVVFMMIVLVTLGAFAITSALVNYRFSYHAADWNKMYYRLENQAERYVMDVDAVVAAAEQRALLYMSEGGFGLPAYEGLSAEAQIRLSQAYATSARDTAALNSVLLQAYNFFVTEGLIELEQTYRGQRMRVNGDESGVPVEAEVMMEFTSDVNPDAHLSVGLALRLQDMPFQILGRTEDSVTLQTRESAPRYTVGEWRQWQTPMRLLDEHDLWIPMGAGEMPGNPDVPEGGGIFDQP